MAKNQSNGYRIVYMPKHERAFTNGTVYEHVLVAEKILGRKIKPCEVIHHKDFNRLNNSADNLIVFASKSEHVRFHSNGCDQGLLIALDDGAYECAEIRHKYDNYHDSCPVCAGIKSITAAMCQACRRADNAKNIPSKGDLLDEIFSCNGNFESVARRHGVTSNTVRKWCRRYGMTHISSCYKKDQGCVAQTV